ncbi:MAG TPA: hypothetical protein VGQ54_11615, partial [Burkholderiales bacterium]|nr:hypothetical protein [Burkholderiales bacterium]
LTQKKGVMKSLTEEKSKILAERHGWSAARAQGYVAGEACRRGEEVPSMYAMVGIDDYAVGFRAGYFVRQSSRSTYAANLDTQFVPAQLRSADL